MLVARREALTRSTELPGSPVGRVLKHALGALRASPRTTSLGLRLTPTDSVLKASLKYYGIDQRCLSIWSNHCQKNIESDAMGFGPERKRVSIAGGIPGIGLAVASKLLKEGALVAFFARFVCSPAASWVNGKMSWWMVVSQKGLAFRCRHSLFSGLHSK